MRLVRKLRALLWKQKLEVEMAEEMRLHLECGIVPGVRLNHL
jgi:hypothetical protein